jgi:ABC-type nitrate/sulfonate/bicarbonate transport system permease component
MEERKQKTELKYSIVSIFSLLFFFLVWYLATEVFGLFRGSVMPSPVDVVSMFIKKLYIKNPEGYTLFQHIFASLYVVFIGYLIGAVIGNILGIGMAWYEKFDFIVRPLFDMIRPIPPIGWIPLMILLFGIGIVPRALIIFFAVFVTCVVNSYSGIKSTNIVHIWVAETFGATKFEILSKVAFPSALPQIFTGLRVGLGMAWMAVVASEMLASSSGLGYMMSFARQYARSDIIIVGMLTIGGIGALLSYLLEKVQKKFVKGE